MEIRFTQQHGLIRIEVDDWGVGIARDGRTGSTFGINGIMERARLQGGQATIDSMPEMGTLVRVELPLVESQSSSSPL